jgi:catechol 2,3-dioxygenase-like lactoylglutathione lyase family enzyme
MAIFGNKPASSQIGKPAKLTGSFSSNPPRLLRLGWLGLKVADVVAESLFLEKTLNLKFTDEGKSTAGHHVRYSCGGLELELVSGGSTWATRSKPRHGQPDVSVVPNLQFNDLEQFAASLKDQEIPQTRPFEQGWGTSLLFLDPERNIWQANEIRVEPALPGGTGPVISALWLSVEDFAAQVSFYQEVLGLKLINRGDYSPPITERAERYQQANPLIQPAGSPPGVDGLTWPPAANGAVFQAGEMKLALSPGGQILESGQERVWGKDTAFLPGFQTTSLSGFAGRLREAGIKTTGPHPFFYVNTDPKGPRWQAGSALRFYDPEGHPLQIYE